MLSNAEINMADCVLFGYLFARNRHGILRERIGRALIDRSNPIEMLTNEQLHKRYRFRREGIMYITELVSEQISRPTKRSYALPPVFQVLITLPFLATGSFYNVVGDTMPRVSASTVCRIFWNVVSSLLRHFHTLVRFPQPENYGPIKQQFYSIAGFPNVIGVVDGTQIPIIAPSMNEADYVNRKGVHALNCQMVCDPWYRITNVVAKWPGSVHDARIFRESALGREVQEGNYNGYLLGESGYPCRKYLMVPYPVPNGRHQEKFNSSLVKTRVIIEQTFGILKRKFACLTRLRLAPKKACHVICVTAMLHNIAVQYHDIDDEGEIGDLAGEDFQYNGNDRETGKDYIDLLANTYFN